MDISIDDRWAGFVQEAVRSGQFGSEREVVEEALRLAQEHQVRLRSLQGTIQAALAEGGEFTEEEVGVYLDEVADELTREEA